MNPIYGTWLQNIWLNKTSSIFVIFIQTGNMKLRFAVDITLVFYRIGNQTLREISINLFKMKMMAGI